MKKLSLVLILFWGTLGLISAQRTISGTIVDQAGESLIGANVVVKGTSVGTISDIDGTFSISVTEDAKALIFSYTGFATQEVAIGVSNVMDVVLQEGAILEEIVVTGLGINKEEKSLGYSATKVGGDELTETRNNSFVDALSGKVAGLTVNSNGAPGGSSSVVMRGYTSITGNNEALIVIDGVPILNGSNRGVGQTLNSGDNFNRSQDFGTQLNDINPDDIESLTVLKGAAATVLYGSEGGAGAIVITTKSGKYNQGLSVDYSGTISRSQVNRLPHLQNTFGQGWNGLWASNENGSWGPKADGVDRLWGNTVNNSRQLKPFSIQEDNLRDFYEYGSSINNSISISGGNEGAAFRLSYSNAKENGVVPSDVDIYNLHSLGINGKMRSGKFSLSSNINYSNKKQRSVATGQGDAAGAGAVLFQEIIQIPRDHSIVDYEDIENPFNNLDNFYTPYAQNPYFTLKEQGNRFLENRIRGSVTLAYDILDNLTARARVGGDFANSTLRDWGNSAKITPGSPNSSANDVVGRYSKLSNSRSLFNTDFFLNYEKELTGAIGMNVLVGANIHEKQRGYNSSYITNLTIPGFYSLSNSTNPPFANDYSEIYRRTGVFGSIDFDYYNWLYLSLTARNDWSSSLPVENNSFFYPGATVSAVLSDAIDMNKDIFSFVKIRASIGKVGSDANPYRVNSVFTAAQASGGFATTAFPIAGVSAFERGDRIGNENLQPTISSEWEIGADLRFLKNRVGVDVAYFNKVSDKQIISKELDPSSGFTTQTINLGEIKTDGIELLLNVVPLRTTNFEWELNVNFAKLNSEVVSLDDTSEDGSLILNTAYGVEMRAEVGQPLGTIYAPTAQRDPNGNIVVNPSNGLPLLADEKEYKGSINPDFTMGFGTSLTFKNWKLSTNLDFRKGGVFYSYTARLNYFVGNAWNSQYNDREPFVVPNSVNVLDDGTFVENSAQVSRSDIFTYWGGNDPQQTNHVLDRTFLKWRNISLEYTLPKSLMDRVGFVKGASISLFGRNLLIWTPAENHFVDPELTTFGVGIGSQLGEFSAIPTSSIYGLTIKLTL